MNTPELDRLAASRNILLTTFRPDGTPVTTAEWVARQGDYLFVVADRHSPAVDRLRVDPRVELAPCDRRGLSQGSPTAATAEVVTATAGIRRAVDLVRSRYGLAWTAARILTRVGGRSTGSPLAIKISVPEPIPAPDSRP